MVPRVNAPPTLLENFPLLLTDVAPIATVITLLLLIYFSNMVPTVQRSLAKYKRHFKTQSVSSPDQSRYSLAVEQLERPMNRKANEYRHKLYSAVQYNPCKGHKYFGQSGQDRTEHKLNSTIQHMYRTANAQNNHVYRI